MEFQKLQKPKAILFDWDGTLVNTNSFFKKLLLETLHEIGITSWDQEAKEKYRYHSRKDAFKLIFKKDWQVVDEVYSKKINALGHSCLEPFAGALELVRYLHSEGVTMAIVSNKEGDYLRKEVDHLGWSKYFHKIVGSTDAKRDKPWPDPVELALEGMTVPRSHVWFIGDSMVDMQCARDTSCFPVLFSTETNSHLAIDSLGVKYLHAHTYVDVIDQYQRAR